MQTPVIVLFLTGLVSTADRGQDKRGADVYGNADVEYYPGGGYSGDNIVNYNLEHNYDNHAGREKNHYAEQGHHHHVEHQHSAGPDQQYENHHHVTPQHHSHHESKVFLINKDEHGGYPVQHSEAYHEKHSDENQGDLQYLHGKEINHHIPHQEEHGSNGKDEYYNSDEKHGHQSDYFILSNGKETPHEIPELFKTGGPSLVYNHEHKSIPILANIHEYEPHKHQEQYKLELSQLGHSGEGYKPGHGYHAIEYGSKEYERLFGHGHPESLKIEVPKLLQKPLVIPHEHVHYYPQFFGPEFYHQAGFYHQAFPEHLYGIPNYPLYGGALGHFGHGHGGGGGGGGDGGQGGTNPAPGTSTIPVAPANTTATPITTQQQMMMMMMMTKTTTPPPATTQSKLSALLSLLQSSSG